MLVPPFSTNRDVPAPALLPTLMLLPKDMLAPWLVKVESPTRMKLEAYEPPTTVSTAWPDPEGLRLKPTVLVEDSPVLSMYARPLPLTVKPLMVRRLFVTLRNASFVPAVPTCNWPLLPEFVITMVELTQTDVFGSSALR